MYSVLASGENDQFEGADKKLDLKQNKFQEVQLYVLTRAKDKGGRSTHTI